MKKIHSSPEEYIDSLPDDRKTAIQLIRKAIVDNLPKGFEEEMSYGMLGYVVPKSIYPPGYHCDTKLPLPFINLASQKNYIALYHMGVYADPEILKWFQNEYAKHGKRKLDMGKSCIRFKWMDDIPFELIAELATKYTTDSWINLYEKNIKNAGKSKKV